MATTFDKKVTKDFSTLISLDECKMLIRDLVSVIAVEHASLELSAAHPVDIDEPTRKMFDLGPNHGMDTADMAKARVAYFGAAQDRLWEWYRKLNAEAR